MRSLFFFKLLDANNASDGAFANLVVVAVGSIVVAFVANTAITLYVLFREHRRPLFSAYARANLAPVAVVSVVATTNVAALELLSSGVFAIGATAAPFKQSSIDMIEMGGVVSVLFEGELGMWGRA